MTPYRITIAAFAVTFVALGVALIVVTALHGGGVGYLIGILFMGLGAGRLYGLRTRK
jgi:hypothetical protein